MAPEDVEALLGKIREQGEGGDNDAAHTIEDGMRADVLRAIADGNTSDPAALARLALSSSDIEFERWYA